MAKRFINSTIWSDPWFQDLDPILKLFWVYIFSVCDMIGIWEYNTKRAEFDLNKKPLPWAKIIEEFSEKVIITDKYWIIKTFISQQYPKLNKTPNAPLHISVLNAIEKKCLNFDLNSLSIDYDKPIHSLQVKVIVKEEVKEEVKVKVKTIETREEDFRYQVNTFLEYDKTMRDNFVRYWTEKNKSGTKMKFEMKDTFEIKKRLVTWSGNNFGTPKNNQGRKLNEFEIGASSKYDGI